MSSTMLIAAPAPTPTVPASSSFAFAFVVLSTTDVAERVRSFACRLWPGGPRPRFEWISAFVLTSAMVERERAGDCDLAAAGAGGRVGRRARACRRRRRVFAHRGGQLEPVGGDECVVADASPRS